MKKSFFGACLLLFPVLANAGICQKYWFHIGGVSKHFEVYQPSETTRFRRQSHPGIGFECKTKYATFASGEFTNSLDRPMTYYSTSRDFYTLGDVKLYGGLLLGEYGRRTKGPLPLASPVVYLTPSLSSARISSSCRPLKAGTTMWWCLRSSSWGFREALINSI